jgi:hypothetical protein
MQQAHTLNRRPASALRPFTRTGVVLLCLGAVGITPACAKKNRPIVVAESPALSLPEPPPRVIVPAEEPLTAAAPTPPDDPAAVTPPRAAARPPVRRPVAASTDGEARPETPAATAGIPAPAPPGEPRELRSAPSAGDALAERNVRDLLNRAARDLARTDYRRLSTDARAQYDQSKRFSEQAEVALRERNFVFASTLADKAAVLAAALIGG